MTTHSRVLAAALLLWTALPASADVLLPEGDAGSVLRLSDDLSVLGRIEGFPAVHGLAAAPARGLLIAGSLAESDEGIERPAGMSMDDHDAHHGDGAMGAAAGMKATTSPLSLVDAATGEIVHRIAVPGMVHHVAVDADERYAVATHPGLGSASLIDLETRELVATIATGPNPNYAVAGPSNGRFVVSNAGNGTLSVIDPERAFVERNIKIDGAGEHMVLREGRAIVARAEDGHVSIVDVASGETVSTLDIGGRLHGVEVDADGTVFVSARERGRIVRLDPETGERTESSPGPQPYHMTMTDRGLLVSSAAEPVVWVVDPDTLAVTDTIETAAVAHQMVVAD